MKRLPLLVVCVCLLLAVLAEGQETPKVKDVYDPSAVKAEKVRIWEQFNQQYQNKWKVTWNPLTGTPRRIYGHSIEIPETLTEANVEQLTRRELNARRELLQIDPQALVLSKADFSPSRRPDASVGTWYVYYRQTHRGVPVYGGSVRLIIRNQRITVLGSDYYPGIDIPVDPRLAQREAARIANQDMGVERELTPLSTELMVYPMSLLGSIRYHLAWRVIMPIVHVSDELLEAEDYFPPEPDRRPQKVPVQWGYFVDAGTGDVINRTNLMEYDDLSGNVTGMIHPFVPADVPVSAVIESMTVMVTQGAMDYTGITDQYGDYLITGLAAGAATLEAHLTGPHVIVYNNETPDPDATHSAPVTVPNPHDWNWDADDPSPGDVETNVFYHVNLIRDYFIRGDPFEFIPDPYPMECWVRDGAYCNAGASVSGLSFGSGSPGTCEDFGLCADIIYHEYMHRITWKIYEGAAGVPPTSMREAWSDYFGSTITDDPHHGGGCYTGRHIDTPDHRYPDDWTGYTHYSSIILSGALWDTRADLGVDYVDNLTVRAMKNHATEFSSYLGAILEEDDDPAWSPDPSANNNPADGTPNIGTICHDFYDLHGIYHTYCLGHTEGLIAVITSPPPTEHNFYNITVTSIDVIGTAAGSPTQPFDHFVVEYASADDPSTWLTGGITLMGAGGTTEISDAILATWNTAAVPDGEYTIRLTVHDTGANTATIETSVIIDRLLRDGWPQELTGLFKYPAAAGNIDPTTPELEVVIASSYYLYVFHADGSPYAPWPLYAGGWATTAPAVADLDTDGDMEIVLASSSRLRAWHHDGTMIFSLSFGSGDDYNVSPSAVIWDLDHDGDMEIITGARDGEVYVVHHDGTAFASGGYTWPKTTGGAVRATPAVADLDDDGQVEIVVGSEDGNVYAWNLDGTDAAGAWPVSIGQAVVSSAAIGDIDVDANYDLEVVVGAEDANVYAWHHDGSTVAGSWPVTVPASGNQVWTSPALADLDDDGDLEILINGKYRVLKVFEHDGSETAGWSPASPVDFGYNSPVAGDLDGDDVPEIVIGCYLDNKLYAYHPDGTAMTGFPRVTAGSMYRGAPLITDLDLDGHPEVIVGSEGVYVWSLPSSHNLRAQHWPTFHHDMRRTGNYGRRAGVVLLFDTSGSMAWRHDGTMGVPAEEQRITLAKNATVPFILMLNDYNSGKANFGIATFPSHPAPYPYSCEGQVVTPMTVITIASRNTAVLTTIPGLTTENNTPLLAGMSTALSMLGPEMNQAVVLLSDGYHNCPSYVSPADPEVTTLIDLANANSIRVFSIGFARPTDPDYPLLEGFAGGTTPPAFAGSQFHDVTGAPGFDPLTWDPAVALDEAYKDILKDALDLQSAADPRGVISSGQVKSFDVKINEHDRRVSFYISWVTPRQGRLGLTVKSSDGQPIPVAAGAVIPGVVFHEGETYKIITVDKTFLSQPGKVGPTPWKIEIEGSGLDGGEKENYQYSVILDSGLRMRTGFDKASYETTDQVLLTTRITEAGQPVTGLKEVYVNVTAPGDGAGNWFATNKVSLEELKKVPEKRGEEILSKVHRKAIFLTEIRKVAFPTATGPARLQLYDDGTHGDAASGDGIYTNRFNNTTKEGTYSFHFRAAGPTTGGNSFDRDDMCQKYVTVKPSPPDFVVETVRLAAIEERIKRFMVTVTPKDALGNYLGPRYDKAIKLSASHGKFVREVEDNLEGGYSQVLQLPETVDIREVKITANVKGATFSFPLETKPEFLPFGVSFHAGATVPLGSFDNDYDPSYSLVVDFDYHFTPQLSAVCLVGYNHFKSGASLVDDTYWLNVSANLKYELPLIPIRPYINGGPGVYIPETGSSKFGFNAGSGGDVTLTPNWTAEFGADYHHIFMNGGEIQFVVGHVGLIFRF